MVHLPVTYQSETIQNLPFYVTRSGSSLMGLDLFDQLGFQVSKNGVIIQSVDIVSAFPSVFTGFGKIARFVHRPRVKPKVTPVSQGLRRLPFSVREEVSRELKRLQDDGMIEPIDSSPWISNLVVALRKSREIRLCADLIAVNCLPSSTTPLSSPSYTWGEATSKFPCQKTVSTWRHSSLMRGFLIPPDAVWTEFSPKCLPEDHIFSTQRNRWLHQTPRWHCHPRSHEGPARQRTTASARKTGWVSHHTESGQVSICQDGNNWFSGLPRVIPGCPTIVLKREDHFEELPQPTSAKEVASFLGTTNFYLKFVPTLPSHWDDYSAKMSRGNGQMNKTKRSVYLSTKSHLLQF